MLNNAYRVIKYCSLDNILKEKNKCISIIERCKSNKCAKYLYGYLSTAEKYLNLYDKEILLRRKRGELAIAEELYEITGNNFTVIASN